MHAQERDAVVNPSLLFACYGLTEPRVDLTGEEIQSVRLFDKASSTTTLQTQQAVICDANEINLNDKSR